MHWTEYLPGPIAAYETRASSDRILHGTARPVDFP
jgi:hypothetical protein